MKLIKKNYIVVFKNMKIIPKIKHFKLLQKQLIIFTQNAILYQI